MPRKVGRPSQNVDAINMWASVEFIRRGKGSPLSVYGASRLLVLRMKQAKLPPLSADHLRRLHRKIERRRGCDPKFKEFTERLVGYRTDDNGRTLEITVVVDKERRFRPAFLTRMGKR